MNTQENTDGTMFGSLYKGYRLRNHGYYPPDRCIWWEAINVETEEADFHAHTKRDLKAQIDEANADRLDLLLAGIMLGRLDPLAPHHVVAISERLRYLNDNELREMVLTGKWPNNESKVSE
jgi:hypothetical protein